MYKLFSIVFWIYFVISSTFLFCIAFFLWVFTRPFDKRMIAMQQFSCFWASSFTYINPFWSVQIEGRKKIKNDKAQIIVSNHQSMVDILVLYRLYRHFKWVSKKEVFKTPFIGWNMTLNDYVSLDRESRSSMVKMMKDCKRHIAMGNSLVIFPEGTRSENGQLRKFKEGAFKLALDTRTPIVPIVLDGSSKALPKKGFFIRNHARVRVRVLDPIAYEDFSELTPSELTGKIQGIVQSVLDEMRQSR
jgi:1-acyl-sn-glycerol-3-phosphate acyltransferase